jgi:hypothetical protein
MPEIELWKVFTSLGIPGLAFGVFYMLFRRFRWKFPQVPRIWVGPIIILFMLLSSGLTFYALMHFIPDPPSDVATIRITILGPDMMPMENSVIRSSIGGETKEVAAGWELEVAESKLPIDRKIIIYAEQKQAHLKGQGEIVVSGEKTTSASILLQRDISARVKGNVSDEKGRPVADAIVSILETAESTTTDPQGFFILPTNGAEGEEVRLRVIKYGYEPLDQYHPAGSNPAYIILRRKP